MFAKNGDFSANSFSKRDKVPARVCPIRWSPQKLVRMELGGKEINTIQITFNFSFSFIITFIVSFTLLYL